MRTLLVISAAALLAGSMAAYAADTQTSEAAGGWGAAPTFAPAERAQVPTAAPVIIYKAPVDVQHPDLSR